MASRIAFSRCVRLSPSSAEIAVIASITEAGAGAATSQHGEAKLRH